MKFLITGGCGFLGSNLAHEVLSRGHQLHIIDNLSRTGGEGNLAWLQEKGELSFSKIDIREYEDVKEVFHSYRPDVVFHVAGQVAMTTSCENPRLDFSTNVLGTFNILECVREYCPDAAVLFSSTNKVYGDLEDLNYGETQTRYELADFPQGIDESFPLNFRTPYGVSKGAADQYMLDYVKTFGLKTAVFRHSSIYGGRQFSTFDQGWVGWFVSQAWKTRENRDHRFSIAGNGKQVRDVLYASDLVSCYFNALENIDKIKGQAFNIGGGAANSFSLLELFDLLQNKLDVALNFDKNPPRFSDQKVFVADIGKASELFGFCAKVSKEVGVSKMIDWVSSLEEK